MRSLYCDGGVVGSNPSLIGGTAACCIVSHNGKVAQVRYSKFASPQDLDVLSVTNNQTELWAMLVGLSIIDDKEVVHVYSDSEITLGRVFKNYAMANIPRFMLDTLMKLMRRPNFHKLKYTLLDGHPTQAHLKVGVGKRGHPVSIWNKWCDDACKARAKDQGFVYEGIR